MGHKAERLGKSLIGNPIYDADNWTTEQVDLLTNTASTRASVIISTSLYAEGLKHCTEDEVRAALAVAANKIQNAS